jgi:hypothetical protein
VDFLPFSLSTWSPAYLVLCSTVASVSLFILASVSFQCDLGCLGVLFYFLVEDTAGSFCTFPVSGQELAISQKHPVSVLSLLWGIGVGGDFWVLTWLHRQTQNPGW